MEAVDFEATPRRRSTGSRESPNQKTSPAISSLGGTSPSAERLYSNTASFLTALEGDVLISVPILPASVKPLETDLIQQYEGPRPAGRRESLASSAADLHVLQASSADLRDWLSSKGLNTAAAVLFAANVTGPMFAAFKLKDIQEINLRCCYTSYLP